MTPSRRNQLLAFTIYYLLFTPFALAKTKEDIRNELPAPINVQAVVLQRTITLTWKWPRPEALPVFTQFGFEVKRNDGKTFLTTETTYMDMELAPGTYTYTVRVHSLAKEKGKPVTYVSDESEPVGGTVDLTCPRPPVLEFSVEPTQKAYSSVPSLRFHIKGRATVDHGCTLGPIHYHFDTGTGIARNGPLKPDALGRFDTFVNVFGPDDEIPTGTVSFSITATAEDEAGPITSNVYTVDVNLRNPFAPTNDSTQ